METVGVRELKENLSRYLRRVKSGETIIVTERKREVAIILPRAGQTEEERILHAVQGGVAYWSGGRPKGIPSRVISKGKSVSDAVLEDRR
jgi:prevent-host-death family protein